MSKPTSWGNVADWYDSLVENENSYQSKLILPNLIRLLEIKKGETILDLACGQGFFAREFNKLGAKVIGVDISQELIALAKRDKLVEYHVSPAHKLDFLQNGSVDKVLIILSLQNIENAREVIAEVSRISKPKSKLFIVLNHPAFRIPKASAWGWDEGRKIQFRKLDSYISESREQIQMHPGDKPWEKTISFHRPLQYYFKALHSSGFSVSRLEEWCSHKTSEEGPKKAAEDKARHEFPLFPIFGSYKNTMIFFTQEKYDQIKKDYQNLLIERKDAVFHLAKAREMGDLSENGYYRASKSKLSSIDFNLRKLTNFIRYGSVIKFVNKGIVEIGCTVTIKNDQELTKYSIVGKEEADPKLGKISNESPLGKLLLGKREGETVSLKIPSGQITYQILKIE